MKKEINYNSLVLDDINERDAPDFCDAYFCYGEYTDGTKIEDEVLEDLSCGDLKYERLYKLIY